MANLTLKHIYKVYPNGVKAVNDFNMEIADKEFIVFVGPSGCGKSTTLRMIAGLEDITAGELTIGENVVNDMEPKDRDIAMVFQNYALYPHMTVYENIAFGLRLRKLERDEIHRRVTEAAEILGITEYLDRKPKEMSGGQRQRVSLGRAIVREPKVMLLDEPLSNLDAKLRTQMRTEISKLHAKLNTTFIYVTHDQVEAMTMGTRIVVMKDGFVQQIDTPRNLYNYPGNKFVAGFIGTPQMNFFEGTLKKVGDNVVVDFAYSDATITVPYSYFYKTRPSYLNGETKVFIGLRAEDISLDADTVKESNATIKVKISHTEELGSETLIYGDINMEGDGYAESSTRVIIKATGEVEYKSGDVLDAALNLNKIHLFDEETEVSILPRIPEYNYFDCEVKNGEIEFIGTKIKMPSAISCADGKGELLIPTDAISFDGEIDATLLGVEDVNGKKVIAMEVCGRRIYAVSDEEPQEKQLKLAIDMKKITILQQGKEVVTPMPLTVSFDGNFKKVKTVEEELGVRKKVIKFMFDIAGTEFVAPDELAQKLFSALGVHKAFEMKYRYECSSYDLRFADQGIPAKVLGICDYGKEKFLRCAVGNSTIYVKAEEGIDAGEVHLVPDIDKIAIIQANMDIRLV